MPAIFKTFFKYIFDKMCAFELLSLFVGEMNHDLE